MNFNCLILSQKYTPAALKRMLRGNTNDELSSWRELAKYLSLPSGITICDAITLGYRILMKSYRSEPVYKNQLVRNLYLRRHNPDQATMLDEFRIGSSQCDLFIVNGESTVYEIKTELDNTNRLAEQLSNYRGMAEKTYLVVHHTQTCYYQKHIKDTATGLISFGQRGGLQIEKEADDDNSAWDVGLIFGSLRKSEYTEVIRTYYGIVPDVPNMRYFKKCVEWGRQIPTKELSLLIKAVIRRRKVKNFLPFTNGTWPKELMHAGLSISPTKTESDLLLNIIHEKI